MRQLRAWLSRFFSLFDKQRHDQELAEELESHLQMNIEDNLRSGMTSEEARREALIKLGGMEQTKEKYRHRRGFPWLETLVQDLRFALHMLRKYPGFTAVAVLTLALGIGATTAIFTVVDAVLIRPLPFQDPSRLVMLWEGFSQSGPSKFGFSAPDLAFVEQSESSFEGIGAFQNKEFDISGSGQPERVMAARVSASVFPMLGAEPILGRRFAPEEDTPGHNVAVLSYSLWQRRYGADPSIIGRTIEIDRQAYTVVGVMPQDFSFPLSGPISNHEPAEVWVPMAFTPTEIRGWGNMYNNNVLARLKPGVTLAQARTAAGLLSSRLMALYPPAVMKAFNGGRIGIRVFPFQEEVAGQVRTPLLILMAAVAVVLLIACANVATLLLSRASARQREIAVRAALGATRSRLMKQLLTESLLLALGGGVLGFVFALWGKSLLLSLVPRDVPLPHEIFISGGILVFVSAVSLLTSVMFGLAPAFQISKLSLQGSLQEGGRSGTLGRAHHQLQGIFVTAEYALAFILLISAGLLIRSFARLLQTDPGFRPDHVLTLSLPLPYKAYPKAAQIREFYQQLLERIGSLPGVTGAGLSNDLPLEVRDNETLEIEGAGSTGSNNPIAVSWTIGNYFQATGISLLRGRWFTPEDREDSQPVLIISQSLARRYWPREDPMGKRIRWGPIWRTIVGIVGDVNDRVLGRSLQAHVYMPYSQAPDLFVAENITGMWRSMNLAVRTQEDPNSMISAVTGQIHSLDPDLPVAHVRTMIQVASSSIAGPKFNTSLLGLFAGVALFLAAIGIYGAFAYMVAQQAHEIGIRLALGAQSGNVLGLFLWRGLQLAGLGAAIGTAAALGLTHLMTTLLYGVSATDPVTFVSVIVVLMFTALLACYIPARRAARVDPMVALRYE